MISLDKLSPIHNKNGIFLENIIFSEYENISLQYKNWLAENLENNSNGFKYEQLNRISFLLSIIELLKKEKINFKDKEDSFTKLIVSSRKLDKYINSNFLNKNKGSESLINSLNSELLNIEKLLESKIDFYNKSKDIVLNIENNIALILGGGGPGGFSHLGVAKVLSKNNIPIHIIGGASMGSIIGTYLSMIIGDNGQISENSLDFLINTVKDIKYFDDLTEEIDGKKYIKTSEIINNYLRSLGEDYSKIPFNIQLSLLDGDIKKNEVILSNSKGTSLDEIELKAKASSANKKIFPDLSPIYIDGKEYEDDLSSAKKSINPLVKYTRQNYNTTLIIGLPVSTIDLFPNIRDFLFKYISSFKDIKDQGDITIESFRNNGLSLNSLFKRDGFNFKFFTRNESELQNGKKITLPIKEYIDLGEKAGEQKIGEILEKLGLVKFTKNSKN